MLEEGTNHSSWWICLGDGADGCCSSLLRPAASNSPSVWCLIYIPAEKLYRLQNNKWFNSIPDAVSGLFFCEQHSKYLEAPAPSERQTLTAYDQIILSGLEFLFTDVLVNLITHCVNICRRHGRNIPHMLKCCSASESWRPSITIRHLICNSVLSWNLSFTFY